MVNIPEGEGPRMVVVRVDGGHAKRLVDMSGTGAPVPLEPDQARRKYLAKRAKKLGVKEAAVPSGRKPRPRGATQVPPRGGR